MSRHPDINLPELAAAIASHLGGAVLEAHECYTVINTATIPLSISYSSYEGRLNISAHWPTYYDASGNRQSVYGKDVLPYDQRGSVALAIHCSPTRPPVAIAKDIARRLIPSARSAYALAIAQCAERGQHVSDRKAQAERLARYGYTRSKNGDCNALHAWSAMPQLEMHYNGEIEFKRLRCNEATACAILDLLAPSGER